MDGVKYKLNFLYRLFKETEINFEISTLWDREIDFYFGINHHTREHLDYCMTEDFEAGIDWLINKYLEYKK